MLNWADRFSIFLFMDGNGFEAERSFPSMLAAGSRRSFLPSGSDPLSELQSFHESSQGWLFGHAGYGLTQFIHSVRLKQEPLVKFPPVFFFEPEHVIRFISDTVAEIITEQDPDSIFREISLCSEELPEKKAEVPFLIKNRISESEYKRTIQSLKSHLQGGDCYEINYCQEFYAEEAHLDPAAVYSALMKHSPAPFSTLYKYHEKYCISASPERFISKTGNTVISQPMKGTIHRSADPEEDAKNKDFLFRHEKDRSENVMIVDLVRNDLSRFCLSGSVCVKELFGIHSFPQVHQMISTVQGEMPSDSHWTDIFRYCFPMGSMTGAPKRRVIELTEKYEAMSRGLYSGSIGYVTPAGDMDFNVVIRSIFYDAGEKVLNFCAGGGITIGSDAEKEFAESYLKAQAIRKILENTCNNPS